MKAIIIVMAVALCTGCASKHAYMNKPPKCATLFLNPDGSCKMPLPTPPKSGRWIWKWERETQKEPK